MYLLLQKLSKLNFHDLKKFPSKFFFTFLRDYFANDFMPPCFKF